MCIGKKKMQKRTGKQAARDLQNAEPYKATVTASVLSPTRIREGKGMVAAAESTLTVPHRDEEHTDFHVPLTRCVPLQVKK